MSFEIKITVVENKNLEQLIESLGVTLEGKVVVGEISYIKTLTQTFTLPTPVAEVSLTDQAALTGPYLKDNITSITTDLKLQSSLSDLGQMKVIVV